MISMNETVHLCDILELLWFNIWLQIRIQMSIPTPFQPSIIHDGRDANQNRHDPLIMNRVNIFFVPEPPDPKSIPDI